MSQSKTINVIPDYTLPRLYVSQYDVGRELTFNLVEGAVAYSIPVGATVKIQGTKPSGFGFSETCTASGSTATIEVTEGMTDEYGDIVTELQVTDSGDVLCTTNFLLVVQRSAHPDGIIDGNQEEVIPELTLLVERAEAAANLLLECSASATTLAAGSTATASYEDGVFSFGIPQGEAGAGTAGVVASAYSSSATYAVGDYVIHNSNLYRCTTAITTAEAWTSGHWTQVVLGDDVSDLKSDINLLPNAESLTWTTGKYLKYSDGTEVSSASYAYCIVEIDAFPLVTVKTMAGNPSGIVFYDASHNYISGVVGESGSVMTTYTLNVPVNASYIGISCMTNERLNVTVKAKTNTQIFELYQKKIASPNYYDVVQLTINQGVVHNNLTIYNPSADYTGRYVTGHFDADTELELSGYALNSNYPLLVIKYDDNTTTWDFGTAGAYNNQAYKMRKAGTVYVNGGSLNYPFIKANVGLTPSAIDDIFSKEQNERNFQLKAQYRSNGSLLIKKRISDTKSICVVFSHIGGNLLWGFSNIRYVNETSGERTSNSFVSNGTEINAGATDWFAPYKVQAVNNPTGDVPAGNDYFTGGNHRSNNTGSGGGVTAVEDSLSIMFGGETPRINDVVYNTNEVVVKWANLVQGNNTSKSDGTGRAILKESWTMKISENGIEVENDIEPLEDIVIKTYYGIQAYTPSANVIYVGGETRTPVAINSVSNSGNKTCRTAMIFDSNFSYSVSVDAVDLGLYENAPYSFLTTNASKLYAYLVGTDLACSDDEHYVVKGSYKFW